MPTALITGATAGIGLAFVHALAGEGYDLVVVARDEERLAKLAADPPGVTITPLPADLATVKGRTAVAERLRLGVDLLVNNAGASINAAFDESAWTDERRLLHLHVETVLQLCHAALPPMVTAGHGDVINVSSVAGFFPTSGGPTYAAEKAFVTALSEGLASQYADRGVRVMALCPGFTYSEFHDTMAVDRSQLAGPRFWLSAEEVVDASLDGLRRRKLFVIPGWRYRLLTVLLSKIPTAMRLRVEEAVGRARLAPKERAKLHE